MKQTKRILASVLSVVLAFSCFAVVPASAEDLATLETYDNVTGVTLVNQKLPDGYDSANLTKDFSDLAAMITARVNPDFGGALSNTLQLSDMDNTFVANKLSGRTNLLAGVGGQMYYGNGSLANAAFAPANTTDGNITTNWYSGTLLGTNAEKGWQPEDGESVVYGDERAATDSFDYQIMYDLGEEKEIDTFYQFGFVRPILQNTTYKVYVGNDPDTIYSDENEVFYYNAYNVHNTYQEKLSFNAIRETTYASATNGLPDGQWVEFKGDKKPTGQYVGFRVYDAAVVGTSGYPGWVLIGELGVLGETAPEPPYVAEGVTGVTLINPKLHDNYDSSKITFDEVAAKIKATVSEKYASENNTLQISDLSQAVFTEKINGRANLVASANSIKYQPWASKGTNTWTNLTAAQIALVADGKIYDINAGSTPSSFSYANNNTSVEYDNSVSIADRIANGGYDYLITADLGADVTIDALSFMGHVRTAAANGVFKIYVGDNKDTLYSDENEVFYYDQSAMPWGDSVTVNGVYDTQNASATAKMSQGTWLELGGETKPCGRYVGVKVIDSCPVDVGYANWLQVYELGVYGEAGEPYIKVIEPTLKEGATTTESGMAWSQKKEKLAVESNFKGTTLQVDNIDDNTLAALGNNDIIASVIAKDYNGTSKTYNFANVTDGDIFDANGSQTADYTTGFSFPDRPSNPRGKARFGTDIYDATVTLALKGKTEIDAIYNFAHPGYNLAWCTYKVYVGNDEATLYSDANEVASFDYYDAYSTGSGYSLNGSNAAVSGGDGTERRSEGQIWKFTDEKPVGSYVGYKIYYAETTVNRLDIYDVGVFGEVAHKAENYVSYSLGSTSALDVVNVGKSGGATILDAEGNEAETIKKGDTITFKAEPVTDSRHQFLGWYNGDTKVSGDLEYTTTFDGNALEAKYTTDLIFLMTPGENVNIISNYSNLKDKNGNAVAYGGASWSYDAEEGAMKLVGDSKTVTVTGDNPDTEEVEESYEAEATMSAGALLSTYTIDGTSIYNTKYEPWTTYKYTVILKATGHYTAVTANAGVHAMNFQNTAVANNDLVYAKDDEGYKTYEFYFNSGAADYRNGSGSVATQSISANLLNLSAIYTGTVVYVKEMSIEKVNTLMVGNVENATVKGYGHRNYKRTNQTSTSAPTDNNQYGGLTKANEIAAYIYDGLAESGVIGAADNGKAMFTVEAADGYDVATVKVNGNVVTADENGVYTYEGAAVDDGITTSFLADGTKTYVVDVETVAHVHVEETVKGYAATCTATGLTDGVVCTACGETVVAQKVIDALGHTEEVVEGYAATCTETGLTNGTKCTVCGETVTAQEVIDALGHTEEVVEGYAATCTEPGLSDGAKCTVCGETVTAQEEIDALGHDMQLNAEKTAKVCANGCGETVAVYVVSFAGKGNQVVYEAIVEAADPYLSAEDIEAAEAAVPEIYGYTFAGWDDDTTAEIVENVTYTATYTKDQSSYTVTVNHVSKEPEIITDLSYDARLEISDPAATQWLINGNVVAIGSEVTLYVAGDMVIDASEAEVSTEPGVAIVHDQVIANAEDNTWATFAHVNAADKEIAEIGFIYVTGTTYGIVGDEGLTMANLDTVGKKYVKGTVPTVGADFMVSYEGITNSATVMRYARAYVIFENDETVYYSNVVGKTFNAQ